MIPTIVRSGDTNIEAGSFQSRNREAYDSNQGKQRILLTLTNTFQSRNREAYDSNLLTAHLYRHPNSISFNLVIEKLMIPT